MVDELVRPKGITKNSNDAYLVTHVVFGSSPAAICTCQYLDLRSNIKNHCAFTIQSNRSATRGMGYLFFTVTLFNAR